MPLVLGGAVVLRLAYLPLEPVLSDDIYRYLWDARVFLDAGLNPYAHPPDADVLRPWRDEWLYPALNSASYHSVYPPLSQLTFALAYVLGGGATWTSYYVLKGLLVAAELGGLWALRRHVEARHLVLYAWHPLALIEIAGQGHTEALAVGGIAVAVAAIQQQRWHVAAAGVAGAGLAKLYPWIGAAWLIRRAGLRVIATGSAVILAFGTWFWYPALLADIGQSLRLYVQLFEFNAGPYLATKELLRALTGADWSKTLGPLFGAATVLGLLAVIWWDTKQHLSFRVFVLGTVGIYVALATTVHPWYLVVIGVVAVLHPVSRWAWMWMASLSIGTYLFYIDGPYWVWVILGWGGAAVLLLLGLMRHATLTGWRARQKARVFDAPLRALPMHANDAPPTVLDIGCGEGAMGEHIARTYGWDVTLTDLDAGVARSARLPFRPCTPTTLPFDDNAFDAALLTFVLHHADDPEAVMQEALRVSRHRVFVLESVAYHPVQRRLLGWTDAVVNAIRSGRGMAPPHPEAYRPTSEWAAWMQKQDARVVETRTVDGWLHPWAVLVVAPTQRERASSSTASG
jgi:SAM-dependent methyltransferase